METIGRIENIEIKTIIQDERKIRVRYFDFSPEIRKRFREYKQKIKNNTISLDQFINPIPNFFQISYEEYLEILNLRESILYNRSIDNQKYLGYILQSLKVDGLKRLCKDHDIHGYSKWKKQEIISYLQDNLSEEEIIEFLKEKEYGLITKSFGIALKIINNKSSEKITRIKIINPDLNHVEIHFDTPHWAGTSFTSINKENIKDPERDCECIVGANMGFCSHFWIEFIFLAKSRCFNLSDWKLTILPNNIEKMIKNTNMDGIKIE